MGSRLPSRLVPWLPYVMSTPFGAEPQTLNTAFPSGAGAASSLGAALAFAVSVTVTVGAGPGTPSAAAPTVFVTVGAGSALVFSVPPPPADPMPIPTIRMNVGGVRGKPVGVRSAERTPTGVRQATVQLWSPSLNAVGFPFVPDQLPVNPKLTDEPAVTFAFQFTFFAVTAAPDWVYSAFQSCETV